MPNGPVWKIFGKEACIVCQKEAGSLSRKRLSDDSIICKDCAKQLSPWFDDFKHATTASIAEQLAQRQLNLVQLGTANFSKSFGECDRILVDEAAGRFCIARNARSTAITSGSQLLDDNPDLVALSCITGIDYEVSGSEYEQTRTVEGKQVSYDPPRWQQSADVRVTITLDHPYISQMVAQLNSGPISFITSEQRLRESDLPNQHRFNGFEVRKAPAYWRDQTPNARLDRSWHDLTHLLAQAPEYAYGYRCTQDNWLQIQQLNRYVQAALETKTLLLGAESD